MTTSPVYLTICFETHNEIVIHREVAGVADTFWGRAQGKSRELPCPALPALSCPSWRALIDTPVCAITSRPCLQHPWPWHWPLSLSRLRTHRLGRLPGPINNTAVVFFRVCRWAETGLAVMLHPPPPRVYKTFPLFFPRALHAKKYHLPEMNDSYWSSKKYVVAINVFPLFFMIKLIVTIGDPMETWFS